MQAFSSGTDFLVAVNWDADTTTDDDIAMVFFFRISEIEYEFLFISDLVRNRKFSVRTDRSLLFKIEFFATGGSSTALAVD